VAGATYEYQIQSKCGVAWSVFSTLAQNILPSGCELDGLTTGDISANSIDLNWNTTAGATKYLISYALAGSGNTPLGIEVTMPNGTIEGLTENSVYAIDVQAFCEFGWGPKSNIMNVQTAPDGLFDVVLGQRFLLYPNPTSSNLVLEFKTKPIKVTIYDVLGQVIFLEKAVNKMDIDVHHLKPGFYFIHASYPDGSVASRKFLKK